MVENITFGAWLKRRRQLDLTQKGLAYQAGCSVGTIRKMEADERRPSRQLAALLAQELDIPPDQLEPFIAFARSESYTGDIAFPSQPEGQTPGQPFQQQDFYQSTNMLRGYELLERIGEGQFGVVHRAIQPTVRREVAIKVIKPHYSDAPDFVRRFEFEAQILARLEHPHIVPLYDYWREASGAYLVMRWLRGGSVKDALAGGPWTLEDTARLVNQIAPALAMAHQQGVVHRDLKPANILLDEGGAAYLSDFGIAKKLAGEAQNGGTDILKGSPNYISPEQAQEKPVTPRTDLYSLGVIIYELLTGRHPFPDNATPSLINRHVYKPLPAVRSQRPQVPASVDQVIQNATARNPADRYADPRTLAESFEAAILGQGAPNESTSTIDLVLPEIEVTNPYRGLRSFQETDAAVFFGRQSLTDRLLAHLRESRFLAVVGPSGSGKSSVVTAGLIPALRRGAVAGSEKWFVAKMIPGTHPLEELEAALLRVAVNPPATLLGQLREDKRGLLRATKRVLPGDGNGQLLLLIDQFEELFTLLPDKEAREHFLNSLVVAVTEDRTPIRVVITLRADFYDRPLLFSPFGQLMREHTEVILPLTIEELRQAIEEPVRRVSAELEAGLITEITAEVGEQTGGLPLLQYALTELFERRQDGRLTRAAYVEIGGVSGALGRRAEELYVALEKGKQAAARQLFLRLVTLGEGVEDTRRRVQIAELASIQIIPGDNQAKVLDEVMEAFGSHRLLTFDRDPITRGPTVEVAHEALLRAWPRLREWLAESRADVRQQRLLGLATAEWAAAAEDEGFLLRGARLDQFEGWAKSTELALTQSERSFLAASLAERQARKAAEEARQQRELDQAQQLAQVESDRAHIQTRNAQRLRRYALGLAGLLLLAIATSIFAFVQAREANQAEEIAQAEAANALNAQATAEASALEAERQKSMALAQSVAAQSSAVLGQNNDTELSALLAIEAARLNRQAEGNRHLLVDSTLRPLLSEEGYHFNNILRAHEDGVWSLALSPDGNWLASGGGGTFKAHDNTIRLWEMHDPAAETIQLQGHESKVNSLAFSPDGQWLASGSSDDTIRLWDVASAKTGAPVEPILLNGHERDVNTVAFSPDSRWLASGSSDHTIRLWSLADPDAEPILLAAHRDKVNTVAFSPDGQWLATGGEDRAVRLWDVALAIPNQAVESILLDGEPGKVNSLAFSSDGQWLAAGGEDQTIRLWDTALVAANPAAAPIRLDGHQSSVLSVAFSPDGRWLAGGSFEEISLRDFSLATANPTTKPTILHGHQDFANALAFSPDGRRLASGSSDNTIRLWNVGDPLARPIPLAGQREWVDAVAFSPDGRWLAAGAGGIKRDHAIRLWKIDDPDAEPIALGDDQNRIHSLAFSPKGKWLAGGTIDGPIRLWEMDDLIAMPILLEDHEDSVNSLAFSPDGKWLASGSSDGLIRLWEMALATTEINAASIPLAGHKGVVESVLFSPDGQWLASAGEDRTIRLWNEGDLSAEPILLEGHQSTISSLAFTPDGNWLVSGAKALGTGIESEETIYFWSLSDPSAEPILLMGYQVLNHSLAISPDGQWLAAAGEDLAIRLWPMVDLAREPILLNVGENAVTSLAFGPDGQWLAGGLSNESVNLWPTLKGLVEIGCRAVRRNLTLAEWNRYLPGEAYRPTCPNLPAHPSSPK